jgi:hypothetical protein
MKRVSVQLEINATDVSACINRLAHLERLPFLTVESFRWDEDDIEAGGLLVASVRAEIEAEDVASALKLLRRLSAQPPHATILGFQLEGDDDWCEDEDMPYEPDVLPFRFGAGPYQKVMVGGMPVSQAVQLEAEARAKEAYYEHLIVAAAADERSETATQAVAQNTITPAQIVYRTIRAEDINPAPAEG